MDISFSRELINGALAKLSEIDEYINRHSQNWSMERMSVVDKNILRLAVYEIIYKLETPAKVAINEAIEISKKYSTEKSKVFINGILDKIKNLRDLPEEGDDR